LVRRLQASKEDDFTEHLFIAQAHNYLLIFTEQGQVYWKKAYEIPEGTKTSKGRAIQNLLNINRVIGLRLFLT
jgi:DNA gyrase subunit A